MRQADDRARSDRPTRDYDVLLAATWYKKGPSQISRNCAASGALVEISYGTPSALTRSYHLFYVVHNIMGHFSRVPKARSR